MTCNSPSWPRDLRIAKTGMKVAIFLPMLDDAQVDSSSLVQGGRGMDRHRCTGTVRYLAMLSVKANLPKKHYLAMGNGRYSTNTTLFRCGRFAGIPTCTCGDTWGSMQDFPMNLRHRRRRPCITKSRDDADLRGRQPVRGHDHFQVISSCCTWVPLMVHSISRFSYPTNKAYLNASEG